MLSITNATEITPPSIERSMIEVTSLHRPDMDWLFTDDAGHEHRWFHGKVPGHTRGYSPRVAYTLPTLIEVKDPSVYDEDGEEIPCSHYECKVCRETIEPGYCPDKTDQYIEGIARLRSFTITFPADAPELADYMVAFLAGSTDEIVIRSGWRLKVFVLKIVEQHTISKSDATTIVTLQPTGAPV